MKRVMISAVIVLSMFANVKAASAARKAVKSDVARVTECSGLSAQTIVDVVNSAKADPGATSICASKVWRAVHASSAAKSASTKIARKSSKHRRAATAAPLSRFAGSDQADTNGAAVVSGPDYRPVVPVMTIPLRDMPNIAAPVRGEDLEIMEEPVLPTPPPPRTKPDMTPVQQTFGPARSAPDATGLNFEGVGVGFGAFAPSGNPPDVEGRVGATQYVQWNNTSFAIFDKATGVPLLGPILGNALFQPLGGVCATHNNGDPVVNYDILSGRWILSQFEINGPAGGFSHQCVAVSVTGDATGSYYLYDFLTDGTNFIDYPHMAGWPDG